MLKVDCDYTIKEDILFLLETENINYLELSDKTGISRSAMDSIINGGRVQSSVYEKLYSYLYRSNYRINPVKEEIENERGRSLLFHGSKNGLKEISSTGSRERCDFGCGFYLGESYNQALSFVCEKEGSSVYSFRSSFNDLHIKKFECDLDWMLAISSYRGNLKTYSMTERIRKIREDIENADVVIAPIADNKMFYIMSQFIDGDINADVALHSLSASKLGLQYIFKTEKAIDKLTPVERYYISIPEREDCIKKQTERGYEIDTKLRLAKRTFKDGLYIEEILK